MDIKKILTDRSFRFNKQFGQNFITDNTLLNAIVEDGDVSPADNVLEIGAGAGTLTRHIARHANKVVALEIDRNLREVLDVTLSDCSNVSYLIKDVMKMSTSEIRQLMDNKPYRVVANIPYYITTPIIMKFLEDPTDLIGMCLTMQKEVALRLVAKENTKEYGAITVAVQAVSDVKVTRIIDRTSFFPPPEVDSAVVRLTVNDKYGVADDECFRKTVRAAFAMRRKTLYNNLCAAFGLERQTCTEILRKCDFRPDIRGEALSVGQFVLLSKHLKPYCPVKS